MLKIIVNNHLLFLIIYISLLLPNDNRPKIGLALSGGAAKGFSHAGALQVIDSLQIPIDYIAATSFGSIIGALYAMGYSGEDLVRMGKETDWNKVLSDLPERKYLPYFRKIDIDKFQFQFDLKGLKPVAPSGLVNGQQVYQGLNKWIGEYEKIKNFNELPIPFKCVAADLKTGNEVVIDKGSISKAIRASCSIPSIFKPVEWGDSLLVDGGVINNLPVDIVREMGADIIIAIDVASSPSFDSDYNVVDVIARSARINEENRKKQQLENADIIIKPNLRKYSWFEFDNALFSEIVNEGYNGAMNSIDELIELKDAIAHRKINKKYINSVANKAIMNISIIGNDNLSDNFLKRLIGIKIGDYFDVEEINNNINHMYALGYFQIIHYTITEEQDGLHLIINVKEKSMQEFKAGIRWDEEKGVIGIAGILLHNQYIPGLIISNQTQFGGLYNNTLNIFYPSRTLDYPIYPFIRTVYDKRDINYYNPYDIPPIEYNKTMFNAGIGLGFLLKNYWTMEVELNSASISLYTNRKNNEFDIDNNRINSFNMNASLDLIDNLLLPSNGGIINISFKQADKAINSQKNYHWYKIESDLYWTTNKHTTRLFLYNHYGDSNIPLYLQTFNKGSNFLSGFAVNQIQGYSVALMRLEYRYKYKNDIYFHLISNNVINCIINEQSIYKNIWSFGVGTTLTSRAGNIEIVLGSSPTVISDKTSYQYKISLNAGYKF